MISLLKRKTVILVVSLSLLEVTSTHAQVIPDGTVNSRVTPQGNTSLIDGGTTSGSNLFHSFQRFSVPTNGTALFNNQTSIQNIISRVTGNSASVIDGMIKANGASNLFFLNPNGIIFGKNARLNIGGSFLGTTADSILFADGSQFSASNPQRPPLLTLKEPVGLNFRRGSGEIRASNIGHQLPSGIFSPSSRVDNPQGLQVLPGKTLALVGGDVLLDGGAIYAPGGRIEIGSIKQGQATFDTTNSQWTFSYNPQSIFGNITLTNRSLVDTTGQGGASIGIYGRQIQLLKDSIALMQNQGVIPDKELKLEATDLIYFGNEALPDELPTGLYTEAINSGSGANIALISPRITLSEGSVFGAQTFTSAPGGNISITASESLKIDGKSSTNPRFLSQINAFTFDVGKAGNIDITTSNLVISNGARLASITFGKGDSGTIAIRADLVELFGLEPITRQGSQIQAGSLGPGNAGSLTIDTSKLILTSGGSVSTTTLSSGDGGNLTINAKESIEVDGMGSDATPETTITAEAIQINPLLRSIFNLPPIPSGNSGNITINTPRLMVKGKGRVSALNEGTGNAGELKISASTITLEDNSLISGATFGGEGGNIFIFADLLLLKDSSITASATKAGRGGNITTIADLVVAIGESSFTAEAEKGQGGNILIAGKAIILGPDVDVSVSSDAGLQASGTFRIVVEKRDFNETSAPAPDVDQVSKIISTCNPSTSPSRFVVKGPGALKVQTRSIGPSSLVWSRKISTTQIPTQDGQVPMDAPGSLSMVEAEGWQKIEDGKIKLTGPPQDKKPRLTAANLACSTPSS